LLKPVGIDKNDVDQMQEWRQVVDLLWSDPQASEGCKRNEHRGSGKHFGPDVSQSVLSRNGIELLVRSHQCKPDGYEYTHKGKVLTVFSASSYFGPGSNLGAYVKISSDMRVRCVQFQSRKTGQDLSIHERLLLYSVL
jgi:serine/threonine-protein phosphatase with EF-hand domain